MTNSSIFEEQINEEYDGLSRRAKLWTSLLFKMDYSFEEAQHTAISKLLGGEIPDGERALELAFDLYALDGSYGACYGRMEAALIVNDRVGIGVLERSLANSPFNEVRSLAAKILENYKSGKLKGKRSYALSGSDEFLKEKIPKVCSKRFYELGLDRD